MGVGLLQAVAALVSTCRRRLSRAAWRLQLRPPPGLAHRKSRAVGPWKKTMWSKEKEAEEVWRKEILLGERCQPLEFSGVIYYDADGRRLSQPPRSPMRSPLPASLKLAANASPGC